MSHSTPASDLRTGSATDEPAGTANLPAIAVEHLWHAYPTPRQRRRQRHQPPPARPALQDISFQVQPGEIFGILGPNGGGKSTLFRILSTMLRPQPPRGTARIFGHDVLHEPQAVRQQLGVVFQHPSLDGKLSAHENLLHQGRLYGLSGSELRQRIDHWLARFDLADRRDEDTEHFSGGMRRRVELAKALLHEPRLLLMDEPATGLDPAARRQMWQQFEHLRAERGTTIALTTHLMDEAERCDRLALISAGKLVAVDTPANLKAAIGGDVIHVEPDPAVTDNAPEQLAERIAERFGPWAPGAEPRVVAGQVRFEQADGAQVVAAIAGAWPGCVRRISVGQPTLEDVFLHLTGQRLAEQDQSAGPDTSPDSSPAES